LFDDNNSKLKVVEQKGFEAEEKLREKVIQARLTRVRGIMHTCLH
jgi:hypothetical protein